MNWLDDYLLLVDRFDGSLCVLTIAGLEEVTCVTPGKNSKGPKKMETEQDVNIYVGYNSTHAGAEQHHQYTHNVILSSYPALSCFVLSS